MLYKFPLGMLLRCFNNLGLGHYTQIYIPDYCWYKKALTNILALFGIVHKTNVSDNMVPFV